MAVDCLDGRCREKREERRVAREYAPDSAWMWRMSERAEPGRTTEPVSRDQILGHEMGQGKFIFPVQLTTRRVGDHILSG